MTLNVDVANKPATLNLHLTDDIQENGQTKYSYIQVFISPPSYFILYQTFVNQFFLIS